jgi:ABC-type amino acid transport substrate-binding protein
VEFNNKAIDAQQKVVGDIIINSKVYFLFNKEETDLQIKTDQAIRKLKADGTLKKLSKQWLGDDYSVEN